MAKNAVGLFVQQNAENLVVDDALRKFGGTAKNFFHAQGRVRFAPDFVEQQQRFSLIAFVLEEARIFDCRADAAGNKRQDVLLVFGEVVDLAALDVENTDHAPAKNERHSQFRSDSIHGVQVALVCCYIPHANGLPGSNSRADNSFV